MLSPLLNSTATGGVWYSGQYDVDNNIQLEKANCSLAQVLGSWRKEADLKTVRTRHCVIYRKGAAKHCVTFLSRLALLASAGRTRS